MKQGSSTATRSPGAEVLAQHALDAVERAADDRDVRRRNAVRLELLRAPPRAAADRSSSSR